jgi:glycosyltransferase involved in cell wall biosynthesis
MSLGLPVIGSPYGSLPELINEDVGFIVKDHQELVSKLKNPGKKFNPLFIRKYIENNFNMTIHSKHYLEKYKLILSGKELNPTNPKYNLSERAENLLPF